MTNHLLALLELTNRLVDVRAELVLTCPEAGALDAAALVDRARRLVRTAALGLARAQWHAEDESVSARHGQELSLDDHSAASSVAHDARSPQATLRLPSSAKATRRRHGNGKGH